MDGVIVIDKEEHCTSHDAVNRMRRLARQKRVGHLGTLDPQATGVLPLVLGRTTRLAQFFARGDKRYDATVRFGYSTDTYDADGEPTSAPVDAPVDHAKLEDLLVHFRGTFLQTPPPVSAKKIGGVPAYRLARKNQPVALQPVAVTVYELELLECAGPRARLRVHCSAGTYLRAIAHELGQRMGCGAFLERLRRTASGSFDISQSRRFPELEELARSNRLEEALIPPARLLPEFPNQVVDPITAGQIRHGRDFRVSPFQVPRGARYVKALGQDGDLIAIGEARLPNLYHPILVL